MLAEMRNDKAFRAGYDLRKLEQSENNKIVFAQPYTSETEVWSDTSAKGNSQPGAKIRITRKLANGDELTECIEADLSRGVAGVVEAVKQMTARLQNGSAKE